MQLHLVRRPKKERQQMMDKEIPKVLSAEEDGMVEKDGQKSDHALDTRRLTIEAISR